MTDCPPVLLLAWHREEHARQVFGRIRAARPAKLYLAVDGITRESQRPGWEKIRALADEVDWPCEVHRRFLAANAGCREAVGSALDWFFTNEEEGIVLEEDCLPDPSFFRYCKAALEHFRDAPQVMQINGTNLCGRMLETKGCRLASWGSPWGWAGWRRAWQSHDRHDSAPVANWGDPSLIDHLGSAAALRFWQQRQKAVTKGWVDSWDFVWQLTMIRNRGLCLVPAVNLIENLGCGGESTHTTSSNSLVESTPAAPHPLPLIFPRTLQADREFERLALLCGLGHHLQPAASAADVTLDIKEIRQPAKTSRKAAHELAKLARRLATPAANATPGGLPVLGRILRRKSRQAEDAAITARCLALADQLNLAAANLEGLAATREILLDPEAGGHLLHGQLTFSQEGEDRILDRLFAGRGTGFYVDVGAHHPFRFSNTWMFYQRGWTGINIDPTPGAMRDFHLWRPRDINLAMAVAATPGELTFHVFEEPAYNTLSAAVAMRRVASGQGGRMTTHTVMVEPLRHILASHLPPGTTIDFLSIDVEGYELEVLAGIDWDHQRPRIILCESLGDKDLASLAGDPAAACLTGHGYRCIAATFNTLIFEDTAPATT